MEKLEVDTLQNTAPQERSKKYFTITLILLNRETDRQRDRQTDRQTDSQVHSLTHSVVHTYYT